MIQFKFDIAQIFIPLLVWLGLLIMPVVTSWLIGMDLTSVWYFFSLFILFLLAVLFYLDYYIFVDKYATIQKWKTFVLINVGITFSLVAFLEFFMSVFLDRLGREMPNLVSFSILGVTLFFMSACLSLAVRMSQSYHWNQMKLYEMNKLQVQTELQNLKSQINPHFLFNTLNNIYALIDIDPVKAQKSIHDLSRMLRYVIYGSSAEKVDLGDEIDFIKDYIKLEKLRLGGNVTCKTSLPGRVTSGKIAPLVLIPFVENAFKHGISGSAPSDINIDIRVEDNKVRCLIENTSFPQKRKSGESGVGIPNTSKRLDMLYSDKYSLKQELRPDGIYVTELNIPLI